VLTDQSAVLRTTKQAIDDGVEQ